MKLHQLITPESKKWNHRYGNAYSVCNNSGKWQTVFEYCIPFPKAFETEFCYRNNICPSDKTSFYQRLAYAVQNHFNVSQSLHQNAVQSILTISTTQTLKEDGITKIYLASEPVVPITQELLCGKIYALTAINIILRLATVIRDLSKMEKPIFYRGFDINEVFLNEENKILLGGFFYSGTDDSSTPAYLHDCPDCVLRAFNPALNGTSQDIRILSGITWGIFAGMPPGTMPPPGPLIYPRYAPEDLAQVIAYGWSGTADIFTFRRRLLEVRKKLAKGEIPNNEIPLMTKYKSRFTATETHQESAEEKSGVSSEQELHDEKTVAPHTQKGGIIHESQRSD